MHKILKYCAILLALFVVALAPAAAADVLYVGNDGFLMYPTLIDPQTTIHNVEFVGMYNDFWTGPSADLEAKAWATINSIDGTGGFYDYNVVFYDMGEFWHYPFGNNYSNGSYAGIGAYELASDINNDEPTVFVAIRSADYTGTSHLLEEPFAIIDDVGLTTSGSFFNSQYNTTRYYILDFFQQDFYNSSFTFVGTQNQANDFVDYVYEIPYI